MIRRKRKTHDDELHMIDLLESEKHVIKRKSSNQETMLQHARESDEAYY